MLSRSPSSTDDSALWSTLATSVEAFLARIDGAHAPTDSVVRRYRRTLPFVDEALAETLLGTSIAEGVRVFRALVHRGVEVWILDETSAMHTGSLKSIDGSLTSARCKLAGHREVVFESGGNTGTALTCYGRRAGLETWCFVPAENLALLGSGTFADREAHLIAVQKPGWVKRAASVFADQRGLPRVPERTWRLEASAFLGAFLLEHLLAGARYDWLVQTISAAFAPVGIYSVLRGARSTLGGLPRFLGVQQASNCTMVRAWQAGREDVPATSVASTGALLTRVMYDGAPHTHGTFGALSGIVAETSGALVTVDGHDLQALHDWRDERQSVLNRLAEGGAELFQHEGRVVEPTGLLALAGALRAIEAGTIAPGARVLCCLTGGTARPDGRAVPDAWIDADPELPENRAWMGARP